jgi:hypothetical protein
VPTAEELKRTLETVMAEINTLPGITPDDYDKEEWAKTFHRMKAAEAQCEELFPLIGGFDMRKVKSTRKSTVSLDSAQAAALCDDHFVVANIIRTKGNPMLSRIVKKNAARPSLRVATLQTITVINTNAATVNKDIEHLADRLKLAKARAQIEELKDNGTGHAKMTNTEYEADRVVIEARIQHVTNIVTKRCAHRLRKDTFHVFCADSHVYLKGPNLPMETLDTITCIRALQKHVD